MEHEIVLNYDADCNRISVDMQAPAGSSCPSFGFVAAILDPGEVNPMLHLSVPLGVNAVTRILVALDGWRAERQLPPARGREANHA